MTEYYESLDMTGTALLASRPNPVLKRKSMNATNTLRRVLCFAALALLSSLAGLPLFGQSTMPAGVKMMDVTRTTLAPRVITNVIEVRIPTNIFISEYRTNQFELLRTNVVSVYRTNWVAKTLTNTIAVEQVLTNLVTRYQTNLNTLNATNWETMLVFKTNW